MKDTCERIIRMETQRAQAWKADEVRCRRINIPNITVRWTQARRLR